MDVFGIEGDNIWLSARKNLSWGKRQYAIVFKTIGYCFYCSFYCFLNFWGPNVFWGRSLGGAPPATESQSIFNRPNVRAMRKSISGYQLV